MIEDDNEQDDATNGKSKISQKKILLITVPILILIGIAVALYQVANQSISANDAPFRVIKKAAHESGVANTLIIYNMPEIVAKLKSSNNENLAMRISLEFKNKKDIDSIESLTPKILDAIIAVTVEMTPDDVDGSRGIYWLKEELLYRINLITAPIEVMQLNFRSFDIQREEKK